MNKLWWWFVKKPMSRWSYFFLFAVCIVFGTLEIYDGSYWWAAWFIGYGIFILPMVLKHLGVIKL